MKFQNSVILVASILMATACFRPEKQNINSNNNVDKPIIKSENDVMIPLVSNKIFFNQDVSSKLKNQLNESISFLHTFPLIETSQNTVELKKIMKLSSANSINLQNWLEERVNFIVPENFELSGKASINDALPVYPENNIFPFGFDTKPAAVIFNEFPIRVSANQEKGTTIMSNIGAGIYLQGKKYNKIFDIVLDKKNPTSIISPRTGLLKVGEGLAFFDNYDVQNVLKNLFQISTLFHEARHSDGHGATLGFLHAMCPSGHDYEGEPACDASTNGPYTIDVIVLKSLLEACGDSCSAKTRKYITGLIIDNKSRLIYTYGTPNFPENAKPGTAWDDTPEFLIQQASPL